MVELSKNGLYRTFILIKSDKIQKTITALYDRNAPKQPGDNSEVNFILQPLHDIHFNAKYNTYSIPQASTTGLIGLLAVALFLLLLGCINFVNLATAQSAQRAKEIGMADFLH